MSYFRRAGRKSSKYAVQFILDEAEKVLATTRDVSSSGMFVNAPDTAVNDKRFFVGDTIPVNVYSAERLIDSTHVEVVRVTDDGFGCHFI